MHVGQGGGGGGVSAGIEEIMRTSLQDHNCAALPFKSMIYFPGLFELNILIAASEGVEE